MGRLFPINLDSVMPHSGLSVALVDDDALFRDSLANLLEMSGMTVEQYDSGEHFLSTAATSQVDCVVLDVMLGDLSGIEVAQQLRASQPDFPVVFITGSIDPVFERQADEIDAAAFLRKPFRRETLIEAIMAATGARAQNARE
jgi:two-component system response regulator FixJ